jgi:hypothetical protein
MFSKKPGRGVAVKTPALPEPKAAEPVERDILRDLAKQRDSARQKVVDREAEIARLEIMIANGVKSEERLAELVGAVTGPDDALMNSSVAIEVQARAAAKRLPAATAELEQAKAARERAEVECIKAARNLMMVEAGKRAAEYTEHFRALCRLHDEMVGISYGVPPVERLGQEIANTVTGFEIPAFNVGGEYRVTMRHLTDERVVANEARRWTAAREAVIADPDADFRAILVDQTITAPPSGSLPPGMTRSTKPTTHTDAGIPLGFAGIPWNPLAN